MSQRTVVVGAPGWWTLTDAAVIHSPWTTYEVVTVVESVVHPSLLPALQSSSVTYNALRVIYWMYHNTFLCNVYTVSSETLFAIMFLVKPFVCSIRVFKVIYAYYFLCVFVRVCVCVRVVCVYLCVCVHACLYVFIRNDHFLLFLGLQLLSKMK